MNIEHKTAWISFSAALLAALLTALFSLYLQNRAMTAQRTYDLEQHRRAALLDALEVVDRVYANSEFINARGEIVSKPRGPKWDIQRARSAINRMLVYCNDPDATVSAFLAAFGTINFDNGISSIPQPHYGPKNLSDFRSQVARELGYSVTRLQAATNTWLATAPGAE